MSKGKSYNREFKEETIRLAEKSVSTQVAHDLSIHPNMIYFWKRQMAKDADKAFPGKGNPTDPELSQLKRENIRFKEEFEILTKAAGIFLNRSGRDTQ